MINEEVLIECPSCKNKSTLKWLNILHQCEYCKIDFPQRGFEAPKPKTPEGPRFVLVDMGYQTNENWYCVKVIQSQMTKNLFDDEKSESLLVELPSGERTWVAHWKDVGRLT